MSFTVGHRDRRVIQRTDVEGCSWLPYSYSLGLIPDYRVAAMGSLAYVMLVFFSQARDISHFALRFFQCCNCLLETLCSSEYSQSGNTRVCIPI
jgi:hypothetical protein